MEPVPFGIEIPLRAIFVHKRELGSDWKARLGQVDRSGGAELSPSLPASPTEIVGMHTGLDC